MLASASQSLADAAEELTFVFSERAELSLAKRKLSDSHARISEIEALVGTTSTRCRSLSASRRSRRW